jgi:hypothetical protein
VNEGAKAGLSLVFSSQRPKGFIDLATQCGRAVFSVATDNEKGYALGMKGADKLPEIPPGYFYEKFSALRVIGAFEPTDDDIRTYLQGVEINTLEIPKWLHSDFGTDKRIEAETLPLIATVGDAAPRDEIAELAESIRGKWSQGMSKSAVSRLLGKAYAGSSWTVKVDRVIEHLGSTTPTTAPNEAKMPVLGLLQGRVVEKENT